FISSRRRHTRFSRDWSSDVCSSDLLAAEGRDQPVALAVERVLLAADLHFLQPRELAQLGVEDVVGLFLAESEALHQHRLRLVLRSEERRVGKGGEYRVTLCTQFRDV